VFSVTKKYYDAFAKALSESQEKRYAVKSGDSLSKIGNEHGVPLEEMQSANPGLKNRNPQWGINPGDKVVVPHKGNAPIDKSALRQSCPSDLVVHVIDRDVGTGIPDALVEISVGATHLSARSDITGYAAFYKIPAGNYSVTTTKDLYLPRPATKFDVVVASCSVAHFEVRLRPQVVLGVHSNVPASAGVTDGHSWITVTRSGSTITYGLWPDDHPDIVRDHLANGDGSDIRTNREGLEGAGANRYYALTETQEATLATVLGENVHWGYTYTCASWASDVVRRVVGEDVTAQDGATVYLSGTPRKLTQSILDRNAIKPTSRLIPLAPSGDGNGLGDGKTSSMGSSL
jgi:LysM repeat protein